MPKVLGKMIGAALAGLVVACVQAQGASRPTQLAVTTPARLIDCAPVTAVPCMRVGLTPSDASGKPAPIVLPPAAQLAGSFNLDSASGTVHPFLATAGSGPDATEHSNVVLLMVDISGSMNQPAPGAISRFAAVKDALGRYLADMQNGSDYIAIVPFESHQVVPTIQAAVFANNKADAQAQLNALPQPSPKGNTALYQAVFTGIAALQNEVRTLEHDGRGAADLKAHLIVMTDGKNEVGAGDDPELLNGPLGLQQAAAQMASSHLDVIGVGFGDPAAIDADALRKLSTRFFYASDANQLLAALHVSRTALSHEIQLTWLTNAANRLALAGTDPAWTPTLHLTSGQMLTGLPIRVFTPATAAPFYSGTATSAELDTLIALHPASNYGWATLLMYGILLLVAAMILIALWFWLPRLIWGERYMSDLPTSQRWASGPDHVRNTTASAVQIRSTKAPAGFEPAPEGGAIQRSPMQTTQLQPRGELSRTRLTYGNK